MKYSVSILNIKGNEWETIAIFSGKTDLESIVEFCISQFKNGNSLDTPAVDIKISDTNSGKLYWVYSADFEEDCNEPEDTDINFDLVGYDPFKGYYEREGAITL